MDEGGCKAVFTANIKCTIYKYYELHCTITCVTLCKQFTQFNMEVYTIYHMQHVSICKQTFWDVLYICLEDLEIYFLEDSVPENLHSTPIVLMWQQSTLHLGNCAFMTMNLPRYSLKSKGYRCVHFIFIRSSFVVHTGS